MPMTFINPTNSAHAVKIDSNYRQSSNSKLITNSFIYQHQQNIILDYSSIYSAVYLHADNNVN